jgi:hypothetical protein
MVWIWRLDPSTNEVMAPPERLDEDVSALTYGLGGVWAGMKCWTGECGADSARVVRIDA